VHIFRKQRFINKRILLIVGTTKRSSSKLRIRKMRNVDLSNPDSIKDKIKRLESLKVKGHSPRVIDKEIAQLKLFLGDLGVGM